MRDAASWLATLCRLAPAVDRTLLEIIAGLLARDTMPPDVLPRIADALGGASQFAHAEGVLCEAAEWAALASIVQREAERPRPGFW